ncbi:copper resistance protein NlpE [Flavobacterium columnare]|nr:copper resistance protein NlpE [Flavobacterium columnare]MCH4828763.1 copper resistance protein NlpE N-terminal domain-containing protein [Flavobacterium columnare]MCH4832017.1 copper resistance protein NlpE N-terminal domain-containing protein [Flavobacterium columnare]
MKKITFILLASSVLLLTHCKKNETGVVNPTEATSENDFIGMYNGTIPCADCPGIYTNITFKKDGKVAKSTLYLDSDDTSLTEYGVWSKENNIIEVTIPNSPKEYYTIKPDHTLTLLNADKKEVSGELAKAYIFEKIENYTSKMLNGTYQTSIDGKGYNQILELKADNDSIYNVKITFTGATKGCTFEGKGKLVNNQIDLDLNKIKNHLKATMTIQFKDGTKIAEVFSSKFDERFDLMYFCGGGASLAGDYTKK